MEMEDHLSRPIPTEELTHSSNSTPFDEPSPSDPSPVVLPPSEIFKLKKDSEMAKPPGGRKNRLNRHRDARLETKAYQNSPEYLKDKTQVRPYRFDSYGPADPNSILALRDAYRFMAHRIKADNSEPFCHS